MASTNEPAFLTGIEQARGYIDNLECSTGEVTVMGWMLHPDTPITDLRVYRNGALVSEAPLGCRPDVGKVFPWIPHAEHCGIHVRVPHPQGERTGRIDLVGYHRGRPVARLGAVYRTDLDAAIPAPPEHLMKRVANVTDPTSFKAWGLKCFGDFWEHLERHGRPGPKDRLLDWGCGCGRLSVHFLADPAGPQLFGCDVDAEAVAWCNENLRAGRFRPIPLYPPTDYEDASFEYVIGYSVFTHLTKEVQFAWLKELRRLLVPGGILVATVHGESATAFAFGGKVEDVLRDGFHDARIDSNLDGIAPPGYYRGTCQSREYTFREWGKYFDILEYKERGIGNHQDAVVMRRPA